MDWISVKDKLPMQLNIPTYNWVLVTSLQDPHPICIARFDGKNWEFLCTNDSWTYGAIYGDGTTSFSLDEISYWMPLPDAPKDGVHA